MKTLTPILIGSLMALLLILVALYVPVLLWVGFGLSFIASAMFAGWGWINADLGGGSVESRHTGMLELSGQASRVVPPDDESALGPLCEDRDSRGSDRPTTLNTSQLKQADVMREAISERMRLMKGQN